MGCALAIVELLEDVMLFQIFEIKKLKIVVSTQRRVCFSSVYPSIHPSIYQHIVA
jgi:hypothetical protein